MHKKRGLNWDLLIAWALYKHVINMNEVLTGWGLRSMKIILVQYQIVHLPVMRLKYLIFLDTQYLYDLTILMSSIAIMFEKFSNQIFFSCVVSTFKSLQSFYISSFFFLYLYLTHSLLLFSAKLNGYNMA